MDTLLVVLIVVLIIVIMVRGPKTIPLIGGMLGRGVKEVRREAADFRAGQEEEEAKDPNQPPAPPTAPSTGPPATPPTA